MILAYDQGFEHGPRDFWANYNSAHFEYILRIATEGGFTALVIHAGLAEKFQFQIRNSRVPLILKLNGKSELYTGDDPYAPQLYSVKDAVKHLGAVAVGYTVYTGSKYEYLMNKEFAEIVQAAHRMEIPVVGWMYPRGESLKAGKSKTTKMALEEVSDDLAIDETPSMVAYGARIGLELGADIVKIKYTGSVKSFKRVVECAGPTKVVMSGGPQTKTEKEFLNRVKDVLRAGAIGIAVGRNIWQRKNALEFSRRVGEVIFK
jgi:class I fructose-bisphosphate aldolase